MWRFCFWGMSMLSFGGSCREFVFLKVIVMMVIGGMGMFLSVVLVGGFESLSSEVV